MGLDGTSIRWLSGFWGCICCCSGFVACRFVVLGWVGALLVFDLICGRFWLWLAAIIVIGL